MVSQHPHPSVLAFASEPSTPRLPRLASPIYTAGYTLRKRTRCERTCVRVLDPCISCVRLENLFEGRSPEVISNAAAILTMEPSFFANDMKVLVVKLLPASAWIKFRSPAYASSICVKSSRLLLAMLDDLVQLLPYVIKNILNIGLLDYKHLLLHCRMPWIPVYIS